MPGFKGFGSLQQKVSGIKIKYSLLPYLNFLNIKLMIQKNLTFDKQEYLLQQI